MKKYGVYFGLFLLSFMVSFYFLQNPLVRTYYFLDTSVYQYIGKLITEGYVPYRDVFDHKGPLFYLWHALGYSIHPMIGQWFLEFVCVCCGLILIYQTACKYISGVYFCLISAVLLFSLPWIDTIGNTESLSWLLIFFLIYAFEKFVSEGKINSYNAFGMGIAASALLFIKPNYLIAPSCFVLYIFYVFISSQRFKELRRFLIYGGIGFFLPAGMILGWLWQNDALEDFWKDYFEFNILYMQKYQYMKTYMATIDFFKYMPLSILSVLSMIIVGLKFKFFTKQERSFVAVMFVVMLLTLWMVIAPLNPHPHYLAAVFPFVLLLIIFSIKSSRYRIIFGLVMGIFVVYRISIVYHEMLAYQKSEQYKLMQVKEAAQFIKGHLKEDEKFSSLFGDYCVLYLYSDRYSANKYALSHFASLVDHENVVNEFEKNQPRVVVTDFYSFEDFFHKDLYHIIYQNGMLVIWEKNNP